MRYLFPIVLLFTALALGGYAYLGGLRTPTVALHITAAPLVLAGQPYAGKVQGDRFGELFREAKTMQENGRLGVMPALANLYYNDPETAHDTIRAFVGLAVADTLRPLPAGWRYRVVSAGSRFMAARIAGVSYLLAPNKLYPAAVEAVQQQKLRRRALYLEQFGPGEAAQLWVGVQ